MDNYDWMRSILPVSTTNKHMVTLSLVCTSGPACMLGHVAHCSSAFAAIKLVGMRPQKGANPHDGIEFYFSNPLKIYATQGCDDTHMHFQLSINGTRIRTTRLSYTNIREKKPSKFRITHRGFGEKYLFITSLEVSSVEDGTSELYSEILEQYVKDHTDQVIDARKAPRD